MTVSLSLKKSLAFAALATPLALVACGSNGDDGETDAAAASTVTSEAVPASEDAASEDAAKEGKETKTVEAKAEESEEKKSASKETATKEAKDTEAKEGGGDNSEANAEAAAGAGAGESGDAGSSELANPFENGDIEVAEPAPVEGGQAASEGDRQAISALVNGIYDQKSMHGFLRYMPDNTCQRVLDENGGEDFSLEGVPDMPMDQMPGWSETHVSDISDIEVNGDQASAVVTVQTAEGPDSATQRFERQGDAWTFCN